jgi:hypothetical protein
MGAAREMLLLRRSSHATSRQNAQLALSPFFNETFLQKLPMILSGQLHQPPHPPMTRFMTILPVSSNVQRPLWTVVMGVAVGIGTLLLLHPGIPAIGRWALQGQGRNALNYAEYGAHFSVFFGLTFLALSSAWAISPRRIAAAIALLTVYAIATEVAQNWVPTRGVNRWDAACNLAGIAASLLLFATAVRRPIPQTQSAASPAVDVKPGG